MKEIGGFFELELPRKKEFHQSAIRLNNGRNALLYLLRADRPSKVYLPAYVCDSVLEPLIKEKIDYQFYFIDENFHLKEEIDLKSKEKILYVNYFGLQDEYLSYLTSKYGKKNIIADNTQAFFSRPIKGVDTFYSARKFFGVADGAYVYSNHELNDIIPESYSYDNYRYLLGRMDKDATSFYDEFQRNEVNHSQVPLKKMSRLTRRILGSIDYQEVIGIRKRNFNFLHGNLCRYNELNISGDVEASPMVYPFKRKDISLRVKLIRKSIYVAKYWREVSGRVSEDSFEHQMVECCLPLPIDQRYSEKELKCFLDIMSL